MLCANSIVVIPGFDMSDMALPERMLLIVFLLMLFIAGFYLQAAGRVAADSAGSMRLVHVRHDGMRQDSIWRITEKPGSRAERIYHLDFDTDMLAENYLSEAEIRLIRQNFGNERFMDRRIVDMFVGGTLTQRFLDVHALNETTAILKIARHTCAVLNQLYCYGFYEFGMLDIQTGTYRTRVQVDLHDETHHQGDCIAYDWREADYRGAVLPGIFLIETRSPAGCPGIENDERESEFWLVAEGGLRRQAHIPELLTEKIATRERSVNWQGCSESPDARVSDVIDRVKTASPYDGICIFRVESPD
jgi:hypothetical protein